MPIFSKTGGENLDRATSIISTLGNKSQGEENQAPPEHNSEEVQVTTETVEQEQTQQENVQQHIEEKNTTVEEPTQQVESASQEQATTVEQQPEETQVLNQKEQVEPEPLSDEVVLSYLSEKLGRQVESYDSLTPKEVQLDPELQQLLEWKQDTGLPLSEWSYYTKDFSKMGDLDVVRETLTKEFPNFTQEELEYELKDYIYNEDMDDESDKIKKSVALKKKAAQGRQQLEKNRLELKQSTTNPTLSKEQQDLISLGTQVQENQAKAQQAQQDYNAKLSQSALNLKGMNLKLSNDLTIKHNIPDGEKKGLPSYISEMKHWYNSDGSYNHDNINLDAYKIKNFDSLMQLAFEQGQSAGKESEIKRDKNINMESPSKQQGQGNKSKGNIREVVSKMTGKSGSNFRFRGNKQ